MENNAENRQKVALAIWDSLSTMDLYEMFINQTVGQYEVDHTKFMNDTNEQAICVHCDDSHDLDADHECKDGE